MRYVEIKQRKEEINTLIDSIMSGQSHLFFIQLKHSPRAGRAGLSITNLTKKVLERWKTEKHSIAQF